MTSLNAHSRRALFVSAPAALAVASPAIARKKKRKKNKKVDDQITTPLEPLAYMIMLDITSGGEFSNGVVLLQYRAIWVHPGSGLQGIFNTGINVSVMKGDMVAQAQQVLSIYLQGENLVVPPSRVAVTIM